MQKNNEKFNRENAPLRYQTLYWKTIELKDVSDFFEEKVALSKPDINVILASKLFKQDEVVLWIWKPNVFLLIPDWKWNHLRYAAKSCWRAPSKLERTRWNIQSWIFMVLKWLTKDEINTLMQTAKTHEWEKNITCVKANAKVMSDFWITLWNWESIEDVKLPITIFDLINSQWLKINWKEIEIEIINTTKNTLEKQAWETRKAVYFTLFRHFQRAINTKKKTKIKKEERKEKEKIIHIMENKPEHKRDFQLKVSNISKLAVPLRIVWWTHTIFKLKQSRVNIDNYLDKQLTPYPDKKPSIFTKIKKTYLFNNKIVWFINKFMQNSETWFEWNSEADFYNMFETSQKNEKIKYNIVASSNWIMVAKIKVKNKIVDWILSKHVLISNYNNDVRFAWEIHKDHMWIIRINNDSWTYKPNEEALKNFIKYARELFPHIKIEKDEN